MKIGNLYKKERKLVRDRKMTELEMFKSESFVLPGSKVLSDYDTITNETTVCRDKLQLLVNETKCVVKENRAIKHVLKDCEDENDMLTLQVQRSEKKVEVLLSLLELVNKKNQFVLENEKEKKCLERECSIWEKKFDNLSQQLNLTLEELEKKKQKLAKVNTRNINKKFKRRDEKIEQQNLKIKEQQCQIDQLLCEKEKHDSEVEQVKRERKNLLAKVCRMNRQYKVVDKNENEVAKLKEEIRQKESRIIELEQINEAVNGPIIHAYFNGKYTNEIRETIMTLISECGVSQSKVNRVMEIVVNNLTGKCLDRLPSTGVKSRLVSEGKRVAQKQVALAMLQNIQEPSVSGNCLHQDGTTKSHRHFQSFQVTTANQQTLSLGLSEVSAGDAETLMSAFKQQVSELAAAVQNDDNHDKISKLVCSITSTMSDQGSVNPVFSRRLSELKQSLLPEAFTSWDTMEENVKEEVSKISSYFCKMHIFVNMASEVNKCLSVFESNICTGKNPYSFDWKESSAARLTRTASKALTMSGCEKSGVGSHLSTYLRSIGKSNMMITFRGHRFNHLFYAAGATYHHAKHIQAFLNSWSDPNDLLKSVSFDIREKASLSGLRALGLVDKLITGPLWHIIERTPSVLDLNPVLHHLQVSLDQLSKDASALLSGHPVFLDGEIHKDDIFESLLQDTGEPVDDTYTQMALELICSGMLLILERQAKDQLPGGQYANPGEAEKQRAGNVPTTNTCSERDFAQLDMLMRLKPSASTTAYEACIMWSNNKTSAWLNSLPASEKEDILNDARVSAPSLIKLFKEKEKKLFEEKLALLRKRQEQKVQREAKSYSQKVKFTRKLDQIGGLWVSEDNVNSFKANVSKADFKEAIISQLQFRKSVLQSRGPKEKFQQVVKGKAYTVEKLEQNLIDVIHLNSGEENGSLDDEPKALKYLDISDAESKFQEAKCALVKKVKEGRNKILASQQAAILPDVTEHPENLIGKFFKHKCRDHDTNEVAWYSGRMITLVQAKGRKSEYSVTYDDDDENTQWRMPLIIDMEKGDFILVD